MNSQEGILIIRQPLSTFFIGILSTLFWGGILAFLSLSSNNTLSWKIYLIFSCFLFLGLWLTWLSIMLKIIIKSDTISFRNLFGKTQEITFESIEKVKIIHTRYQNGIAQINVHGKDGKKLFSVPLNNDVVESFFDCMRQKSIRIE